MTTTNYLRVLVVLTTMAAVLVAAAGLLAASAAPSHAATTFTVNQTGDASDITINDDICDVSPFVAGSQCNLRAAIEEANDTPGADTINFNIPGRGVKTISPNSALPPITDQATINGYFQSGSSENTQLDSSLGTNANLKIVLDGTSAGDASGLTIEEDAQNSVVRGLSIVNFDDNGIEVVGADNALIAGNHIGLGPDGSSEGNGGGVRVQFPSDNVSIGGKAAADHNVISANSQVGVVLAGTPTNGNRVLGNLIGLAPDGASASGNGVHGVLMNSGSSDNTIGGADPGASNRIAFNAEDGVHVDSGTKNQILPNSIFSNGSTANDLGIDLFPDGPNANDPGDADSGPNNLQNFPKITSARTGGGQSIIRGRLNSTPNKTFNVQLFSNPPGTDEGKKFLGEKSVTTDGSGNAFFTFAPAQPVGVGKTITATATRGANTSEFSAPKTVVAQ